MAVMVVVHCVDKYCSAADAGWKLEVSEVRARYTQNKRHGCQWGTLTECYTLNHVYTHKCQTRTISNSTLHVQADAFVLETQLFRFSVFALLRDCMRQLFCIVSGNYSFTDIFLM
jgi:hypothetical protein